MAKPDRAQTSHGFKERFRTAPAGRWHLADYDFSHPHFDTDWRRERVRWLDDQRGLHLEVQPKHARGAAAAGNRFEGASLRRLSTTGFGRYETIMQSSQGAGLVSGLFLYTGPYYGTRHDEIDIEFLGRNTRSMQASWFVDGRLETRQIPLGFDASARARRYAFEWWPDRLRWFVEGQQVLEVTRAQAALPEVPGYLYLNLWAAAPALGNWAGHTTARTAGVTRVRAVGFTPLSELSIT